jgi:hypothetical protein
VQRDFSTANADFRKVDRIRYTLELKGCAAECIFDAPPWDRLHSAPCRLDHPSATEHNVAPQLSTNVTQFSFRKSRCNAIDKMGVPRQTWVPSSHRTPRVFSVCESLRRRYAPDVQQFATPAPFELRQLKECLRSHSRSVGVSAKSSGHRA